MPGPTPSRPNPHDLDDRPPGIDWFSRGIPPEDPPPPPPVTIDPEDLQQLRTIAAGALDIAEYLIERDTLPGDNVKGSTRRTLAGYRRELATIEEKTTAGRG